MNSHTKICTALINTKRDYTDKNTHVIFTIEIGSTHTNTLFSLKTMNGTYTNTDTHRQSDTDGTI